MSFVGPIHLKQPPSIHWKSALRSQQNVANKEKQKGCFLLTNHLNHRYVALFNSTPLLSPAGIAFSTSSGFINPSSLWSLPGGSKGAFSQRMFPGMASTVWSCRHGSLDTQFHFRYTSQNIYASVSRLCVCVSKSLIYNHGRLESSTKLQLSMLHVPPEKSKIHRNTKHESL